MKRSTNYQQRNGVSQRENEPCNLSIGCMRNYQKTMEGLILQNSCRLSKSCRPALQPLRIWVFHLQSVIQWRTSASSAKDTSSKNSKPFYLFCTLWSSCTTTDVQHAILRLLLAHTDKKILEPVKNCVKFHRTRGQQLSPGTSQAVPRQWPLQLVVMNILGQFPKTVDGNQFIIAMPYRYSKLTLAIPISKTTALHAVLSFIDSWFIPYCIHQLL